MQAKYPYQSPYAAFNNSPIYFADPTGLEGDPPKNTLGAPVAKEGDITRHSIKVTKSEVASTKDNGFQYRDEDKRLGHNYYWVENGGDFYIDDNGVQQRGGAYYRTPYVFGEIEIVIDAGQPEITDTHTTKGSKAKFKNVDDLAHKTLKTSMGYSGGRSISTINGAVFEADLSTQLENYYNGEVRKDNGNASYSNIDYHVTIKFEEGSENAYTRGIVSKFTDKGFTIRTKYGVSGAAYIAGTNQTSVVNSGYIAGLVWHEVPIIRVKVKDEVLPTTNTVVLQEAIEPTIIRQKGWKKKL